MNENDRERIWQTVVRVADQRLNNHLVAIYAYGSSTTSDDYGDVDVMIVVERFTPEIAPTIRSTVTEIEDELTDCDTPLDLFIYGVDEIPTGGTGGYGIFTSLFQVDYRKNRKLLYGRDVLADLPDIDLMAESCRLLRGFRRLLRHLLVNASPDTLLSRALIGQGRLDFHQPVATETEDQVLSLVQYMLKISCKCYLEPNGVHRISKNELVKEFKRRKPEHDERINQVLGTDEISEENDFYSIIRKTLIVVTDCHNELCTD